MESKLSMPVLMDKHNAFVKDGFGHRLDVVPKGEQLTGLTLAVKDVFDVAGMRVGAGNEQWLAHAPVANQTATTVRLLLEQGAVWVGKTITDELTYSLSGMNKHYGTPRNPAAIQRITGGSSSGSAVAVAAHYADIGLGTDCGGSIRLPASYCGLWGFRPSHSRISNHGCISLAHSFDTVGWLTRDLVTSKQVFEVLANTCLPAHSMAPTLLVPEFINSLLGASIQAAFTQSIAYLRQELEIVACLPDGDQVEDWAAAFRAIQASEAWQQHGEWVEANGASLGGDVRLRFLNAKNMKATHVAQAQGVRLQARKCLDHLLDHPDTFMILPTVSSPAPLVDADEEAIEVTRRHAQKMLCMAGLAGLPQISMPWIQVDGAPVGLSLIGARGADEALYGAAQYIHAMLKQHRQAT